MYICMYICMYLRAHIKCVQILAQIVSKNKINTRLPQTINFQLLFIIQFFTFLLIFCQRQSNVRKTRRKSARLQLMPPLT